MFWPTFFVSHGAPSLLLEPDQPAHQFLRGFSREWGRPDAILVISAHWETAEPTLTTVARLETLYDFGGFDPALYTATPEHFLPLLVAWGAAAPGMAPRRVHTSVTLGVLAMDAYVFP